MRIGVDYYPEHWPKDRWPTDARLMREAGISVVRLAEFAWSTMEPERGRLDFDWLEAAVELLAGEGISVVLGTPTATPPKWLCDGAEAAGESIYQVDYDGRVRGFGTRRHYCANSEGYRKETRRIVDAMAQRFAESKAVIAWQIDNEFGCHDTTVCYCDSCRQRFRRWLSERYGSVERLNEAWGTTFWSQEYRSFDEVIVPAFTAVEQPGRYTHNPGLLLDYQRFSSDSVISYQKLQIDSIRAHSSAPITHNFMGRFADIDYYRLATDLDFISWDNYPANQWGASDSVDLAMSHDVTRGTKGRNYWVMEQLSGPCGWATLGPTPSPGQIRLWTYQGFAHGADAIVYFRWRPARFGTEQYWYGILDHDGVPRRRYAEVTRVGTETAQLSETVAGTGYPADVLLVRSFDNLWSHRFQPHSDGLSYDAVLKDYYRGIASFGAQSDVGAAGSDLSRYRLVVAPMMNLTTPETEAALAEYVETGGTLIITFRSGTREWTNAMRDSVPPGPFADLAGVEVEEFDSLSAKRVVSVEFADGHSSSAKLWVDVCDPKTGTEVIATYGDGFYRGRAAVTRRQVGSGTVYYVGADLDAEGVAAVVSRAAGDAGVVSLRSHFLAAAPETVELTLRSDGQGTTVESQSGRSDEGANRCVLFLMNHSAEPATVEMQAPAVNLLGGGEVSVIEIEGYGVSILEAQS